MNSGDTSTFNSSNLCKYSRYCDVIVEMAMSWILISCFLIRSRSRSSGPSYRGMCTLYAAFPVSLFPGVAIFLSSSRFSLLCVLCVKNPLNPRRPIPPSAQLTNFRPFLLPAEDGFADSGHGFLGLDAGAIRTVVDDFEDAFGVLLVLDAAVAHWGDPFDQMIGHFCFALDAAYGSGAAAFGGPLQGCGRREQFMPVVDGTHVRISGVDAALAGWVSDHHFRLLADVIVGFAQRNRIAVTLRHLAAVEPRYPRRLRQLVIWFRQRPSNRKKAFGHMRSLK